MSARRGLNLAYHKTVENLNKEEREEFESELHYSMVELTLRTLARKSREKEDRKRLAASLGEIG